MHRVAPYILYQASQKGLVLTTYRALVGLAVGLAATADAADHGGGTMLVGTTLAHAHARTREA
jgi:hypothetical protein